MTRWWLVATVLAASGSALVGCGGDAAGDAVGDDDDDTSPPPSDVCADQPGVSLCDGNTAVVCSDAGLVASFTPCDAPGETCAAGACVPCAPAIEVPYADPDRVDDVGVWLEVDAEASADRPARLRPVTVSGAATLSLPPPFAAFHASGAAIGDGDVVAEEQILVGATEPGAGELTFSPVPDCDVGAPITIQVTAAAPVPIAVRALDGFPWFESEDVFTERDAVSARIDLAVHPDREGLEADVYVLPHRSPAAWLSDRALSDAEPATAITVDGQLAVAWSSVPSLPSPLEPYDLVVDFGRDGQLDPGDLLDGLDAPGFVVGGDLSAPGPYTPVQFEVSQSYWTTMRVYHPAELDQLDPIPLVVISHGNGHDYTWYDYLGNHLASHGYAVIAHRNNTGPGPVTAAETTWQNTQAFLQGLPLIQGGVLDGEVDTHAIAWIGHSRGGEGVVIAYNDLVSGDIAPSTFGVDDIALVSSIAPTVFESPRNTVNPHDVPYHLIAGSLDGDVTGGVDNPITQYFRILQNATGLHAVTYVQGADHNDFNCCGPNDANWTSGGPGVEIGRNRAQQAAKSYYLALLEATFHQQDAMWAYFARAPENFRPDGVDVVVATQLRRAAGDGVFVVDDFQANPALDLSSSGGAVTATVRQLAEGPLDDDDGNLTNDPSDAFNGMSQSENDPNPARGIVFQWDAGDDDLELAFALPATEQDLRDDAFVSFRACQATRHPNTVAAAEMLSFGVALVDGAGNVSEVDFGVYGGLTMPYGRNGLGSGTGWVNEFQTIRVPIEAFAAEGRAIDLSDITAIRFLFGPSHGSAVGRIGFDDLELLAPGAP